MESIRKRKENGEIVILPTDKSGRFAIMSMDTYIKAGEVHTLGDEEIGLSELKANQRRVNGEVSMLLKILNVGADCQHEGRWRESMINHSLETYPLSFQTIYLPFCYIHIIYNGLLFLLFFPGQVTIASFPLLKEFVTLHNSSPQKIMITRLLLPEIFRSRSSFR